MSVTTIPELYNGQSISLSKEPISTEDLSVAVRFFYTVWESEYGDPDSNLFNVLNFITIISTDEEMNVSDIYDKDGTHYSEKVPIVGLTFSPTTVWIWIDPSHKVSDSSLVHELVHVALWVQKGDGDADHEGGIIEAWTKQHSELIDIVNQILKDHGK